MENGRSRVTFNNDPSVINPKTSIGFTLPPAELGLNPRDNSVMIPAWHFHPSQQEYFFITAGTCLFDLNGEKIPVKAGGELVVPKGEYHRFTNASTTEDMSLEAWYDPADLEREERVFRSLCGYLADQATGDGGMSENMSVLQLALFAWESGSSICDPRLAKLLPKWIGQPLFTGLTWVLGVFLGEWMMGYKRVYEEYYHPASK
jgi:mannose-6-phosphate isomerase-like protein (cupin superfamily)